MQDKTQLRAEEMMCVVNAETRVGDLRNPDEPDRKGPPFVVLRLETDDGTTFDFALLPTRALSIGSGLCAAYGAADYIAGRREKGKDDDD